MDYPYIIWTLRRTGGTTIASLFGKASSFSSEQHEPFNPDRRYGHIVSRWNETFEIAEMRNAVAEILENTPVIKHCFEIVPMQLNAILLEESIRKGYKQIFLRRRNEIDRIFSLEIAALTGAWSPEQSKEIFDEIRLSRRPKPVLPIKKSINHMSECYLRSIWLISALQSLGASHEDLIFEDLFSEISTGKAIVARSLRGLGHSEKKIGSLEEAIIRALSERSQHSKQIENSVTNISRWRAAMQGAWSSLQGTQAF